MYPKRRSEEHSRRPWVPAAWCAAGGTVIIAAAATNPYWFPPSPCSLSLDHLSDRTAGVGYSLLPPEHMGTPVVGLDEVAVDIASQVVMGDLSSGYGSGVAIEHPLWIELRGPPSIFLTLLLLLVIGSSVALSLWRFRRLLSASRARASLGSVASTIDPAAIGMKLTLEGTLVVEGGLTMRLDDGQPAGAATAASRWAKVNTRAQRLSLDTGQTQLLLSGPVEVHIGSACSARPQRLDHLDPAIHDRILEADEMAFSKLGWKPVRFHSVDGGERVRVTGTLEQGGAGEETTYREPSHRWSLLGTKEAPLKLACTKTPRARASSRPIVIGAAIGVLTWLGVVLYSGMLEIGL